MNQLATHDKLATPVRDKPRANVEFIDPKDGKLVSRSVILSVKTDLSNLNRLMIWAAHHSVELRIRPSK